MGRPSLLRADRIGDGARIECRVGHSEFAELIEPLLIAIIGGFVGAAVIALYMPMFNIIKLIK